MAKAEATVEELVSKIENGELRLPEMQRRYVWKSTRVRDLLDSLYRGYPSGAILLWETDEDVPEQEFAVGQTQTPHSRNQLLLDGQQRLTSLAAVIRGKPVTVRGRRRPIELLFNLDHPDSLDVVTEVDDEVDSGDESEQLADDENGQLADDEADSTEDEIQKRFNKMTFVVSTRKLESLPQWVKVTDVFKADGDADFLKRAGLTGFEDRNYKRYSERLARLRAIRKYTYRVDILERSLSYSEVTEIFVRVNSLGAKLRSSDLALAQITAKWRGALKEFQSFQDACGNNGFPLDLGLHTKNLVAFATGQSRFNTVHRLSRGDLEKAWKESCRGMDFALNFVKSNLSIESPALLSSPFILIALAYYGHKRNYELSPEDEQKLRYWVLIANTKGRYSRGSTETLLDQDLATLRDGGDAEALIERLRNQVGRLDITPEDIEGRTRISSLFKLMFLAFQAAGAKDWKSKLKVAINHSGTQHKLQFHHIFPKAVLKGRYSDREVNDIANLCFIAGKTNRQINDKTPKKYFPSVTEEAGAGAFELQCVPTDSGLLDVSNYDDFLKERRVRIAKRLNEFLDEFKN